MAALVLRIKFPMTYPLIYKTLRVDANYTADEAVRFIAETVNVQSLLNGNEGLYVPDEKRWLDKDKPLSSYESLQDVVRTESDYALRLQQLHCTCPDASGCGLGIQ